MHTCLTRCLHRIRASLILLDTHQDSTARLVSVQSEVILMDTFLKSSQCLCKNQIIKKLHFPHTTTGLCIFFIYLHVQVVGWSCSLIKIKNKPVSSERVSRIVYTGSSVPLRSHRQSTEGAPIRRNSTYLNSRVLHPN